MAVKTQLEDFRGLMTKIRRKEFADVYLLMGEEPYYIDRLVEALEENVVPAEERDFNVMTVYGQDADMPSLIAACQQYPFMSDRKLVVLKEAQSMIQAKNRLEHLAEYVLRPSDVNVLVVVYKGGELSATSKLMKAAKESGAVIFKSPALRDYQLDGPIKEYCTARRIGIQDKAMMMLKEYLGTSLEKIFSEIDKLIVAGGAGMAQITPEMIERNIGLSKDFNNYELCNALGAKDYAKCMLIVKSFARNPKQNPTVMTTASLYGFFSRLLIGLTTKATSEEALASAMELKSSYALKDYRAAFTKYTPMQALKAIHFLREFDAKSKGVESNQNEYDLLTELIFNIFAAR